MVTPAAVSKSVTQRMATWPDQIDGSILSQDVRPNMSSVTGVRLARMCLIDTEGALR